MGRLQQGRVGTGLVDGSRVRGFVGRFSAARLGRVSSVPERERRPRRYRRLMAGRLLFLQGGVRKYLHSRTLALYEEVQRISHEHVVQGDAQERAGALADGLQRAGASAPARGALRRRGGLDNGRRPTRVAVARYLGSVTANARPRSPGRGVDRRVLVSRFHARLSRKGRRRGAGRCDADAGGDSAESPAAGLRVL
jgi:hypothetical protein